MSTASEKLTVWRAQISVEIEQLEGELLEARQDHADAEAQHSRGTAEWADLFSKVRPIPSADNGIAEALYSRMVNERDEALRAVSGRRTRARFAIKALEERLGMRRLALRQIDEAIADARKPSGPVILKAERPKPTPVQFDTIVEGLA